MDKLRCGIIGTGGMGMGHVNIVPQIEEIELTCVSDINPDAARSAAEKAGVKSFDDPVELLDSGLADMVIIATPHYYHPQYAIEAFQRGIHVLSEKPICVTVSEADSMIQAAKASGKQFGVMYQMRSASRSQAARKLVEEGRLGDIYRTLLVMGWFRSQAYYDSGTWRATWKGEGGGVLINQAPHFLDLFSWLGGLPTKIHGQVKTRLHNIEVEDEAYAMLDYANGATGYLYASTMEAPSTERIEICGDKGKLALDGNSLRFWEISPSIGQYSREAPNMWGSPDTHEVEVEYDKSGGGHGDITRNFARSILHGEKLLAPGEEGLNAVELINGIILSGKRGKAVDVPVDRAEYDALLEELQAQSQEKATVNEQRETDPHYV